MSSRDDEDLEMDEESALRRSEMEMHTLNQLNSLLKIEAKPSPTIQKKRPVFINAPNGAHEHEGVDFNLRLIKEVRARPFLFDVSEEAYNNPAWRSNAWADLATIFECSPDQVKTRWKTLRDKFKKEERKNGDASTWALYNELNFLQPHLKGTILQLESNPAHKETEYSFQWAEDSRNDEEERGIVTVDDDIAECPSSSKRRRIQESPPVESRLEEIPSSSHSVQISRPMARQRPHPHQQQHVQALRAETEEDEVFGHMIALRLGKMDPRTKEVAKLKMMHMLYEMQYGAYPSSTQDPS